MNKKTYHIISQVLDNIKPSKEELKEINDSLEETLELIKKRIKILKIEAEVFVGGSYAKNTLIRKDKYDIDVFIRFNKKHKENISSLIKKILKNIKNVKKVHGSRDYYRIKKSKSLYIEIVPVLKISRPEQAENITDLSYSHVKYINKKIKPKKLHDDIRLAKAFCYANNCYGAESYIRGFSGYSLELLVYHYGSFIKFLSAISKIKKDKNIIDIEKLHKNKQSILMDLNSSKLDSPIILIDPTNKNRNALAALSDETLIRFQKEARKFMKSLSIKSFEKKKIDLEKIINRAKKNKNEFILIEAKTNKQSGDIAGSKLLKFYNHLTSEIENYFEIKNKGFIYNDTKSARYFFVVIRKKEILHSGPNINDKNNAKAFKKKHKKTFTKNKRLYAKEKINFDIKKFLSYWIKKNKKTIEEMYVSGLEVIG